MVAVLIGLVLCCGWSCDVTSSLYVINGTNNLKMRLIAFRFDPHWHVPYQLHPAMFKLLLLLAPLKYDINM
jgi:hypothetical protein